MLDKLDLNTKAQELRELLGEDANSPIDIFSLANQIDGLTLVFYPLGENISGMCVRDNIIKLIAINSTMSYGRQRFSLAHELCHLYFDDESGFNVCSKRLDPKSENEKCADQFASYFLAPYRSLRAAIKKTAGDGQLSMQHVIALEQYFGMSHLAMFWRLVSEGYLSSDKLKDYSSGVISAARYLGFDDKLYKPTPVELQKRTYGHYLKQVEELRQKDLVSLGKIDELLLDAFCDDIVFGFRKFLICLFDNRDTPFSSKRPSGFQFRFTQNLYKHLVIQILNSFISAMDFIRKPAMIIDIHCFF